MRRPKELGCVVSSGGEMEEELEWWDEAFLPSAMCSVTHNPSHQHLGRQETELGLKCPRVKQHLPHPVREPGIPFSRPSAAL